MRAIMALCGLALAAGCGLDDHFPFPVHDAFEFDLSFDGGTPPDLAPPTDLIFCNNGDTTCKESAVFTCNNSNQFIKTYDCPLDCASTPMAHCKQMVPTAPVTTDDIKPTLPTTPATWATATTVSFDTEAGEIDIVGGAILRHKNTTAAYQEMDGIGFRVTTFSGRGYAIWSFGDITVSPTSTFIFKGKNNPLPAISNAAILVSNGNINVLGIIDARGYDFAFNPPSLCSVADPNGNVVAGPGGGLGGTGGTCTAGAGDGGGACVMQLSNDSAGGGGGGFGEYGGLGGSAVNTIGGKGGAVNGSPTLSPLVGGSGGGRGNIAGVGGGGGGAVQLVALGKITIGAGGGINAGGCSGKNTHPNGGNSTDGAGGGGSGGSILLEAKAVEITTTGVLAANGGSGAGAGRNGTNGSPGALSDVATPGGTATGNDTAGGAGSGGQTLAGSSANVSPSGAAGGGGGGAGRIGIRSLSFVNNGIISPALNAMNSKGEKVAFAATLPTQ